MRRLGLVSLATLAIATCSCVNNSRVAPAANQVKPDPFPEEETPLAFYRYIQGCGSTYRVAVPISGITTSDTVYAWVTLSKFGQPVVKGIPQKVAAGPGGLISSQRIYTYFEQSQVPTGTYELEVYLADSPATNCDPGNAITSSGVRRVAIDYAIDYSGYCIDGIVFGDSVSFRVDSVPAQGLPGVYSWIITPGIPSSFDGTFTIRNRAGHDDDRFVRLGPDLFLPLKATKDAQADADRYDWELIFVRERLSLRWDTTYVDLKVQLPTRLGDADNGFDQSITTWSECYGVPPQVVKSIVRRESSFDQWKFRYEMHMDSSFQSVMFNSNHYRLYLLADSGRTGEPKGFNLAGDSITQGDSIGHLPTDPYALLRENSLNAPVVVKDDNQDHRISRSELSAHNSRFPTMSVDWVAQIVLCSSYGPMQPIHESLIDFAGFGRRNPQTTLRNVDGIQWGTRFFSKIFYSTDWISTSYSFDERLRAAVGKYNGGPGASEYYGTFGSNGIQEYVDTVMNHANDYKPKL
jgi:hypothetical protein